MPKCLFPFPESKEAIAGENISLSYGQLEEKINHIIALLKAKGLKPNERIVIKLPNGVDFILSYLACIHGGFTAVPVNLTLPQNTVDYILKSVKPHLIIEGLGDAGGEVFVRPHPPIGGEDERSAAGGRTQALCKPLGIFYTSGTTSLPKGVCHDLNNFLENAKAFNALVGIDASVRMLHVMPMGYMAGFLNTIISPIVAGGTIVIAPQLQAATASKFWETAIKHEANAVWLTPTMLALLSKLPAGQETIAWAKKNLKHVFVGTAPLPAVTKKEFEEKFHVPCLESYGLSEAMIVTGNTFQYPRLPGSVGRAVEGTKIEVIGESRKVLDAGQEGDIRIKSPYMLKGYFDNASNSFGKDISGEWFDSGDYGYIDRDGNLFITGRKKDIIIHGGTNVSPRNVEEVLLNSGMVKDAAVIGSPHAFWGEEVVAFIIPTEQNTFSIEPLKQYCKQHLYADAVPSQFKICEDFPRASTGKVQKNVLKEQYVR